MGSSERNVELAEARRIDEHVDFEIFPRLTVKPITENGRPCGATMTPAAPFTRAGCATMPPFVSEIEIARPPEEVFSYVTDPLRFSEWQDDVVSAHIEGGGPPGLGSRLITTRRIGRTELTQTQEITDISPPSSWAVQGVDGPIRAKANITVEPLDEGARSRVTIALDFEGPGIGKVLVPLVVRRMAEKQAPRSYKNLKTRLENGVQQTRRRGAGPRPGQD